MSESTYPYTVEQFAEAYRATGMKARAGLTFMRRDSLFECGCPQGVLAVHLAKGNVPDGYNYYDWSMEMLGLSADQFSGFVCGFDGGETERLRIARSYENPTEAMDAFERGLECRKRFLGPEGAAQ